MALDILRRNNYETEGLRCKDWSEFSRPHAPEMNCVFTLCDNAAKGVCSVWPGQPVTAHWGIVDPVSAEGDVMEKLQAFRVAFRELDHRIEIFISLPFESLDKLKLQQHLNEIGKTS